MLSTRSGFRNWVEGVGQSYLWPFFPCSTNYSWDKVQKQSLLAASHSWAAGTPEHFAYADLTFGKLIHNKIFIFSWTKDFPPCILLSKSFSHLLLRQNNLLARMFHSRIRLSFELVLRSQGLGADFALGEISNKNLFDFPVSCIEPLRTMVGFLEELRWPWTRSCCFALSKENCLWWRNNQNFCLFKWMPLKACTERQSPSLRLWGYLEPPINQHAGTESSVLEEMHSDLAYAYSGGATRGNRGAQIVSGVWLKTLHSACKCHGTGGTVGTAHSHTKCSFPASLTRLLLLVFFLQGTEWNPHDRYMLVQ